MDLKHYIRVYDDSLESQHCARLIAFFESQRAAHFRNGRDRRGGLEDSAWTELNLSRMLDPPSMLFFRRLIDSALERYNRSVQLPIAVPNSPLLSPLILKRYSARDGDSFQLHFDSIYDVSDRYLVFLWYLNDVDVEGGTRFPHLDLTVAPKAGRLLMFPPYWMYQHQGLPSPRQDKYILSTYLRFPRLAQSTV
ncbi:2OG-Fe(II) oxygenase [Vulcaniibacterium tengchongense]|uniref:2-oxoglutarate-Fe(II)-dependent oxygenase superfamily protein n=1 Tax=Vulcaniibacterium tengchongense TaxID=1273429 RepID=A0A3N4VGZ9_9GAMM|nr:2OG-Fe(II) oxygenase [Vulcaniibacterium tengchongense]RPE80953.1 2-oxoglutarate-Fe(II)-dependent oxygenase superfamily protein [Vulcaniibacterium tengchongense]